MPGLGAPSPLAILWAKAAVHHGWPIFWANGASQGESFLFVGRYVELVQKRDKNITMKNWGYLYHNINWGEVKLMRVGR
jgi:hypothetical protein